MTCILGIHDPAEGTILAADGRLLFGDSIINEDCRKILSLGPWLVGVSGHSATMALLAEASSRLGAASDAFEFARIVGELFRAADYRQEPNGSGPPGFHQSLLLARADGLWVVPNNLGAAVVPARRPCGIGSGGEWAEGAAFEALRRGASLERAVIAGVEAAIAYDSGCGGTIFVARAAAKEKEQDSYPGPEPESGLRTKFTLSYGPLSISGPLVPLRGQTGPAEIRPWQRPNRYGELPGGLCCQRAAGQYCYEHDPQTYTGAFR